MVQLATPGVLALIMKLSWLLTLLVPLSLYYYYVAAVSNGPFSAALFIPAVQELGDEVTCQVVITNNDDVDYFILKRGTPLEGLKSNIFSIKKDNIMSDLPYDGLLFKLAPPTEEDFVLISGSSHVTTSVTMSQAYEFYDASFYSVQLSIQLYYSESLNSRDLLSQELSSNTDHFLLVSNGKQPQLTKSTLLREENAPLKLTEHPLCPQDITKLQLRDDSYKMPSFTGSWPEDDKAASEDAYARAFEVAHKSYFKVDSSPGIFKDWFGDNLDNHIAKVTVRSVYHSIVSAMSANNYKLQYFGKECEHNIFAYTSYKSRTLVLCYHYFNRAGSSGYDTKFGTIIHELTHSVSKIGDISGAVNPAECRQLAARHPDKTIDNANNYEYFSETVV